MTKRLNKPWRRPAATAAAHDATRFALKGGAIVLAGLGLARACERETHANLPTIEFHQVAAASVKPKSGPAKDGPMCTWADAPRGPWPDALGVLLADPITRNEERWVLAAIDACNAIGRTNRQIADPFQVLALFRLEEDLDMPIETQGLLNSIRCTESAMRDSTPARRIRGDFRDGVPTAFGPFQMQEWQINWCGLTMSGADDVVEAARCWVLRTQYFLEKSSEECGAGQAWRVSEAMTSNPRRYGHLKCQARRSLHWRVMEQVQAMAEPAELAQP